MPPLTPDLSIARRFLDLFGEGGPHFFQVFHDSKKGSEAWNRYGTLDDMADALVAANGRGLGVYFTVNETNGQGRTAENVTEVRALFLDLDGAPLEPVLAAGVEPHAVVESSPGKFQVYWLVKECSLDAFTPNQIALARRFSGDQSVQDLPRVMRVPGFYHLKRDPFPVRLVSLEAFQPYAAKDLAHQLDLEHYFEQAREERAQPLPPISDLLTTKLSPGERHRTMLRYAGKYARDGLDPAAILLLLHGINAKVCEGQKPDDEIKEIVRYVVRKHPFVDLSGFGVGGENDVREELAADAPKPLMALPPLLVKNAPGLVGDIAEWLTRSNFYPQLSYSLAAALSFVGSIKGHLVQTEDNLRTNLYTVVVGYSSSGKTIPIQRLNLLAQRAGGQHWILGEPSSAQGLRAELYEAGGKGMVLWDEMGMAIKDMLNTRSQGYRKEIIRSLMKLHSEAGYVSRAQVTAGAKTKDHNGNKRDDPSQKDIDQPCLCVYGTSTPVDFFGGLTSTEAVNGLISRLLVFETHDYLIDHQDVRDVSPPENLVNRLGRIVRYFDEQGGTGNLAEHITVNPTVIPYSADAEEVFACARDNFEAEKRAAICKGDEVGISLWGRALEHSKKVALTCEDGPRISGEVANWAVELVTMMVEKMCEAVRSRVVDNQHHADVNKLIGAIQAAGKYGITMKDLNQKVRGMDTQKRTVALKSLEDEGTIVTYKRKTNPKAKKDTTYYVLAEFYDV